MPGPIRAVLFDKDGTLFDFFATWAPAYEAIARHTAGDDPAMIEHLMTIGGRNPATGRFAPASVLAAGTARQLAELWAGAVGRDDVAELTLYYDAHFHRHGVASAEPVCDLPALFGRLRDRRRAAGRDRRGRRHAARPGDGACRRCRPRHRRADRRQPTREPGAAGAPCARQHRRSRGAALAPLC